MPSKKARQTYQIAGYFDRAGVDGLHRAIGLMPALTLWAFLAGCGLEGDRKPVEPNFRSIHDDMLTVSCTGSGCHGGSSPEGELGFDQGIDAAYAALMTRSTRGQRLRVEPFEPQKSEFYLRLTGESKEGAVMPQTGKLPKADLAAVRKWIEEGAEK